MTKLQVRLHDTFWESPAITGYPLVVGTGGMLDNWRGGLDELEGQWAQLKEHGEAKAKKHGAAGWGGGRGGWPASWGASEPPPFIVSDRCPCPVRSLPCSLIAAACCFPRR